MLIIYDYTLIEIIKCEKIFTVTKGTRFAKLCSKKRE